MSALRCVACGGGGRTASRSHGRMVRLSSPPSRSAMRGEPSTGPPVRFPAGPHGLVGLARAHVATAGRTPSARARSWGHSPMAVDGDRGVQGRSRVAPGAQLTMPTRGMTATRGGVPVRHDPSVRAHAQRVQDSRSACRPVSLLGVCTTGRCSALARYGRFGGLGAIAMALAVAFRNDEGDQAASCFRCCGRW